MHPRAIFIACCLIIFLSLPVFAGDEKSRDKPAPLTRLDTATEKLMKGLDDNQVKQFASIRNSHGVIRAVEDVEKRLDAATRSCALNNPDIGSSMAAKLSAWKGDIDPVLSEGRQRLAMMIKLQDFAKIAEARSYLKLVDDAVTYKARGVKTIPITEAKECRRLLDKMDDTQSELKKLLVRTLGLKTPVIQADEK